jgi:hypothetical protein
MKSNEEMVRVAAIKEAYERVFSTEEGKMILDDLAKKCLDGIGVYVAEANQYIYNEGKRSIFMYLLDCIKLDFKLYAERFVEGEFEAWKKEMERQLQRQMAN